ncbi:MAG: hypothetical protein KDI66_21190 [Xanthomonadales bacterium]|nr:hypothetical protein [Xanthomonadales bacterium]
MENDLVHDIEGLHLLQRFPGNIIFVEISYGRQDSGEYVPTSFLKTKDWRLIKKKGWYSAPVDLNITMWQPAERRRLGFEPISTKRGLEYLPSLSEMRDSLLRCSRGAIAQISYEYLDDLVTISELIERSGLTLEDVGLARPALSEADNSPRDFLVEVSIRDRSDSVTEMLDRRRKIASALDAAFRSAGLGKYEGESLSDGYVEIGLSVRKTQGVDLVIATALENLGIDPCDVVIEIEE